MAETWNDCFLQLEVKQKLQKIIEVDFKSFQVKRRDLFEM
jgi:hypothetical protein